LSLFHFVILSFCHLASLLCGPFVIWPFGHFVMLT
jgi:hypothetical protein